MLLITAAASTNQDTGQVILGFVLLGLLALGYALFAWAYGSLRATRRHLAQALAELAELRSQKQ